jgi:hypothetical protein
MGLSGSVVWRRWRPQVAGRLLCATGSLLCATGSCVCGSGRAQGGIARAGIPVGLRFLWGGGAASQVHRYSIRPYSNYSMLYNVVSPLCSASKKIEISHSKKLLTSLSYRQGWIYSSRF